MRTTRPCVQEAVALTRDPRYYMASRWPFLYFPAFRGRWIFLFFFVSSACMRGIELAVEQAELGPAVWRARSLDVSPKEATDNRRLW